MEAKSKIKRCVFSVFLILFFFVCPVFSQNTHIDSLMLKISNSPQDTNKVIMLGQLTGNYILKGNYKEALKTIEEFKELSEKLKYRSGIAVAFNETGIVYDYQGLYDRAMENYSKALQIFAEINDKNGVANAFNNIGVIFQTQGNYTEALKNYYEALKLHESLNKKFGITEDNINIGNIYYYQKDFNKALEYYSRGVRMAGEIDHKMALNVSLNNIGTIYNTQKKYPEALNYFLRSKTLREKLGNRSGIAQSINNIGTAYSGMTKYEDAIKSHKEALIIYRDLGEKMGETSSLIKLGKAYSHLKKNDEAIKYTEEGLKLAGEFKLLDFVKEGNETLSEIYSEIGKTGPALEHYRKFIEARDSLNNEEISESHLRMEMNYEFEKKQAVEKIKQEQMKTEAEKQKVIRNSFIFGFLIVIIFSGFLYNRFRIISKQKIIIEEQKELVEEKQKEVLDSIHYAKRIQTALITNEKYIDKNLNRLQNDKI